MTKPGTEVARVAEPGRFEPIPVEPESEGASLIRLAIEKNLDVDKLERLVALKERAEDRRAAQEFAAAMAQFASECPNIKKSSTASIVTKSGTKFNYSYAELDEIARVTRPILQRCGLSYSFDSLTDGQFMDVSCTLRHVGGYVITTHFKCPLDSQNPMSGAQKAGAALTYAKRQALASALGLTTTDDDTDGAAAPDVERITAQQADDLLVLAKDADVAMARVLKYAKVERAGDILASQYHRIVAMLQKAQDELEAKREAK